MFVCLLSIKYFLSKCFLKIDITLLQVGLQVVQSVFVGYIAEYFSFVEPTNDQFRDVCLFSLGLVLTGLLVSFVHAYGFHMGFRESMDARIITISAIYQKVHVLCLYYSYVCTSLRRCIVINLKQRIKFRGHSAGSLGVIITCISRRLTLWHSLVTSNIIIKYPF